MILSHSPAGTQTSAGSTGSVYSVIAAEKRMLLGLEQVDLELVVDPFFEHGPQTLQPMCHGQTHQHRPRQRLASVLGELLEKRPEPLEVLEETLGHPYGHDRVSVVVG